MFPKLTKHEKLENLKHWLGEELCDSLKQISEKATLHLPDVMASKFSDARKLEKFNELEKALNDMIADNRTLDDIAEMFLKEMALK